MLKSMTGFGRRELLSNNRKFSVEIKGVNHKYGEINIKLPRFLNEFELEFREIIAKNVNRGKVDVYINFETYSKNDINVNFNKDIADVYYNQLNEMIKTYNLESNIPVGLLSNMPDVLTTEKQIDNEDAIDEIVSTFSEVIAGAVQNFVTMREAEGEKLEVDIINKIEQLKKYVEEIDELYPADVQKFKEELTKKTKNLLAESEIDENRILMEVMIYSDKICVDEEITRLYCHIEQFYNIIKENNPVGRKLDFLIQEINREINTIGSKSNNIDITKNIVDMKTLLEKIREQVQNIE